MHSLTSRASCYFNIDKIKRQKKVIGAVGNAVLLDIYDFPNPYGSLPTHPTCFIGASAFPCIVQSFGLWMYLRVFIFQPLLERVPYEISKGEGVSNEHYFS